MTWRERSTLSLGTVAYERDAAGAKTTSLSTIKIFKEDRIIGIIGGTYLIDVDDRTKQTLKYFEENNIKNLYLCHCTSFRVKSFIDNVIPLKEVGVGMKIKID